MFHNALTTTTNCSNLFLRNIHRQKLSSHQSLSAQTVSMQEFNVKLGNLCTPYPNVHLVNNDNITVENFHDSKHLKRKRIGLLVTNLKDTVFNRIRGLQSRYPSPSHNARVSDLPSSPTGRQPSGQREFHSLPRAPVPGNNHLGLGVQPLYSSVVKRDAIDPKSSLRSSPPPLNLETVFNLLKLYETMRPY